MSRNEEVYRKRHEERVQQFIDEGYDMFVWEPKDDKDLPPPASEIPRGKVISINKYTPEGRCFKNDFHKLMFEYFESVTYGATGWGLSFLEWLSINHGWEHLGCHFFKRAYSVKETFSDNG